MNSPETELEIYDKQTGATLRISLESQASDLVLRVIPKGKEYRDVYNFNGLGDVASALPLVSTDYPTGFSVFWDERYFKAREKAIRKRLARTKVSPRTRKKAS